VATVLTCIGVKDVASYDNDFCIRILENDVDALTSQSDESFLESDTDFPTNGSNILVTITGIPPLVGIAPRSPKVCEDFDVSDPNYCPGGLLEIQDGVSVPGQPPGQLQFFYQVDYTNTTVIEAVDLCFRFWSKGPLPPGQAYSMQVTVALTDTNPPNGEDMPAFKGNEATNLVVVQFYDCDTNLLYPFATNYMAGPPFLYNNFGSIILVANTTWDPLATATPSPSIHKNRKALPFHSRVPANSGCSRLRLAALPMAVRRVMDPFPSCRPRFQRAESMALTWARFHNLPVGPDTSGRSASSRMLMDSASSRMATVLPIRATRQSMTLSSSRLQNSTIVVLLGTGSASRQLHQSRLARKFRSFCSMVSTMLPAAVSNPARHRLRFDGESVLS